MITPELLARLKSLQSQTRPSAVTPPNPCSVCGEVPPICTGAPAPPAEPAAQPGGGRYGHKPGCKSPQESCWCNTHEEWRI